MKNFFIVAGFICFFNLLLSEESEFLIDKKSCMKNDTKISESIIENSWKILRIKSKFDLVSVELNKFLLDVIESGVEESDGFSKKDDKLQKFLDELIVFKKDFKQKTIELNKKFSSLSKKYQASLKAVPGKLI